MVSGCTCSGRLTIAKRRGNRGIAAGNQPGTTGAGCAAGTGGAAVAAGAVVCTAGRRRRGGRNIGCHVGFPFPLLGLVILIFLLGNLLQEFLLLTLEFLFQSFQIICLCQQLLNQIVRLLALGIQLCLGCIQLQLCQLHLFLFADQLALSSLHLIGSFAQFFQSAVIGSGNLFHNVQPVQQIRKAVGFKEHFPVGKLTFFFHGANPDFIFFTQGCKAVFCNIQFILLVSNQNVVGSQLIVHILNLGIQQLDFLINHILTGNDVRNLVLIFLVLILNLSNLVLDLLFFLLQLVDLLPDLAGRCGSGRGGQQTQNQGQQHHKSHHACENGYHTFAVFHRILLLTRRHQ